MTQVCAKQQVYSFRVLRDIYKIQNIIIYNNKTSNNDNNNNNNSIA